MTKSEAKQERMVWIKTTRSYKVGNLSAVIILTLIPTSALVGLIWAIGWLRGLASADAPDLLSRYKFVVAVFAAVGVLCLAWLIKDIVWHFLHKFWMTEAEHEALLVIHRSWCDDVDYAEENDLPEPKRPY